MEYVIGVDIGGTFTDLVCIDEGGNMAVEKVPSTPADPSLAMVSGIAKLAEDYGKPLEEFLANVVRICHGTTVSTNTVLTWTGAKVGLLTTKGFRDSLEIRFAIRESVYDYTVPAPKPLAPRYLRIPIEERVKWDGSEPIALNEDDVRKACTHFRKNNVESVAVCFLWSFRNPNHEKRAVEICHEELPDVYVCGSYEVQPEIREYWRTSTTVLNAYVGPKLSSYIKHLDATLKESGFTGDLLIVQSNAGVISPEVACQQAARTLLSGPSCAPAAAIYHAPTGIDNMITIDMGGTSLDVCLIKERKPIMALESAVAGVYHLKLPLLDVHTIGAGGGSVAWLDDLGVLHIGPKSAGADPGPACYNKGGIEPTVTDADLVLGYLNPDYFLGGIMKLDFELARKAIKENVADLLGISVAEAARSIKAITDHNMSDAISAVSVQRGEDARRFVMVTAGGAGPVHAASLAKELNIQKIMVPRHSSIFCALGSIIADIRHDFVRTVSIRTNLLDPKELRDTFAEMETVGNGYLQKEGVSEANRYYQGSMDMRYKGQFHEVEVPVDISELSDRDSIALIVESFHQRHDTLYAYRDTVETEIINLRLAAYGRVRTPSRKKDSGVTKGDADMLKGKREVYFEESKDFLSTPIYDGDNMFSGNIIKGPAIVEQRTTTIVVPPKAKLEVTPYLDYLMHLA